MFRGVPTNQTAKTAGGPGEPRAEGPSEGSLGRDSPDAAPSFSVHLWQVSHLAVMILSIY